MKKYLITGFSGFVSRHFVEYLNGLKEKTQVLGLDINAPDFDYSQYNNVFCSFEQVNLLDTDSVENALYNFKPDYILHLASYSSVGYSWQNPVNSFKNNTNIFLTIIDKVKSLGINCRIISVGSSEEYGIINNNDLPLKETNRINPSSPYAVARVAQNHLSKVYVEGFDLDIIITRSFNHIGPYQKDIFAIPSFVKQLVEIKKENKKRELITGNISVIRDFVDVRDVVRAYFFLFKKGKRGEVYNICSGNGHSLKSIIDIITKKIGIDVKVKIDSQRIRRNENPVIIGSFDKINALTGWKPEISTEKSIEDIINYWKNY